MAFQRVPNTVEVVVEYDIGGEPIFNTYHAEAPAGYDQTMLDGLVLTLESGPVLSLLADQSIHCVYKKTSARGLDQLNDITAETSAAAANGGRAVQGLPAYNCFVVQRLSGLTGRNARGRVFVPGLDVGMLEPGTPNVGILIQSFADAYNSHIDGFRVAIEGIGLWNAVIVSRWLNNSKRAEGVTFQWNTTAYQDRIIDVRRSRKR